MISFTKLSVCCFAILPEERAKGTNNCPEIQAECAKWLLQDISAFYLCQPLLFSKLINGWPVYNVSACLPGIGGEFSCNAS